MLCYTLCHLWWRNCLCVPCCSKTPLIRGICAHTTPYCSGPVTAFGVGVRSLILSRCDSLLLLAVLQHQALREIFPSPHDRCGCLLLRVLPVSAVRAL